MGLKRIVVAVVAVVAAVGMSGCSGDPGVAAIVEGQVITENSVQSTVRAATEILARNSTSSESVTPASVLQFKIMEVLLAEVLDQMGGPGELVGGRITDDQRNQWWQARMPPNSPWSSVWEDPQARGAIAGLVDIEIVDEMVESGMLDVDKLRSLVMAVSVTVNPRYGAWDSMALTVFTEGVASLADPTPFTIPE